MSSEHEMYGVNVRILEELINRIIVNDYDFIRDFEIEFLDQHKVFIFFVFYVDSREFNKKEELYTDKLINTYGDIDFVPDDEYQYFDDMIKDDIKKTLNLIIYNGFGLSNKDYRLVVELVE